MIFDDAMMLLDAAHAARKNAHAPYSNFLVGAALLATDGRVFVGCNVENSSYGATVCAERVALGSAIAAGAREFSAIAVVGGKKGELAVTCPPCGICRQALSEVCAPSTYVVLEENGAPLIYSLGELLPMHFSLEV